MFQNGGWSPLLKLTTHRPPLNTLKDGISITSVDIAMDGKDSFFTIHFSFDNGDTAIILFYMKSANIFL